jgi:hypothetical protein
VTAIVHGNRNSTYKLPRASMSILTGKNSD